MIGVVVVAHFGIAKEMIGAVSEIMEEDLKGMVGVSVDYSEAPDSIHKKLTEAIETVDEGEGVLIFTDMFGGTPSNVSLSFLEKGKVEVISGLNLPMLLKVAHKRGSQSLAELVENARSVGRESIKLASGLLSDR